MNDTTSRKNPDKTHAGNNGSWTELSFRAPADIGDVMALAKTNLEHFTRATDAMLSGMKELNEEIVRFAGTQFDASAEAARSILSAGTPAEALGRHVDYARSATQAYLSQATKLFEVAARVSQNGMEAAHDVAHHTMKATKTAVEKSARK
ncbi:MAG: phasin family protein [Alphaproteobacteria bacterium]